MKDEDFAGLESLASTRAESNDQRILTDGGQQTVEVPVAAAIEARDELERLINETSEADPDPLTDRTFRARDAFETALHRAGTDDDGPHHWEAIDVQLKGHGSMLTFVVEQCQVCGDLRMDYRPSLLEEVGAPDPEGTDSLVPDGGREWAYGLNAAGRSNGSDSA